VTPVFGEFLGPAGEHIAAAVSFRGELPYSEQCGVVRQLDRLVATLARYLADLPLPDALDPAREPERDAGTRAAPARLALDRAARNLGPAAAGAADASASDSHRVVGHLSAAADHLAAGRDLLHTHFAGGPAGLRTPRSYWAPVITSEAVTVALLSELAGYTQSLASWIAKLPGRRVSPGAPTSAHLALHRAEPWLRLAGAAIQAAQRERYPLATARRLLDSIPANAPPPRLSVNAEEPVAELCERIPVTAERLRHATLAFAARARWSPAATSLSWRRDALASAIASHSSELILRTLAERAGEVGMEPALRARLRTAAEHMTTAWTSWRAVTGQWDIVTTGSYRGAGLTPVAEEIGDLALQAGRLAYRNPHWTPACSDTSLIRDPADLAQVPGDIITVLAAVHHAADAIGRIAAKDQEAVAAAAADSRLYVPVRLLPDKYDIPHPYTPAPRQNADALLAAYDTAVEAATRVTEALDDLATAVDSPSSLLAAARQASAEARQEPRRQQQQQPAAPPYIITSVPGRTEHALRTLRIHDPALLLRAAVIDQAARDLVAEAATKAHSRDTVTVGPTSRPAPGARSAGSPPARVASQDTPLTPHAGHPLDHRRGSAAPAGPVSRNRPARQGSGGARSAT
jgi:hypothetical protein